MTRETRTDGRARASMSQFESVNTARRTPEQPELAGMNTDTGPMWAIAFLPLVSMVIGLIPSTVNGFAPDPTPTGAILNVLSLALILGLVVVGVLLAVADRRTLQQRGVIRPMHPAWELLDPVYVIGRAVVVRRRVRGSMNPLWLWIGTSIVAFAINSTPR